MSHIANTTQNCFQPTAGYPFIRGQWVGPTASPAEPVPPMARSFDTVNLTSGATSQTNPSAGPGCVTVKSGDSLSELLLQRGYSVKEMYQKDDQGKTMIDRIADSNGLRNPNLIYPGQQLDLPGKDRAEESSTPQQFEDSCCCNDSPAYGPDFFDWAPTYQQLSQPWSNTADGDYVTYEDYGYIPQELFL